MPTYEYKCTECTERFEIEQSIHEDTLSILAGEHHEHQLKKVFSPVGISFRGDGFYKNDARGKPKSKTNGTPATTDSSTDSKSSDATTASKSSESSSTTTSTDSSPSKSSSDTSSSSTSKSKSDSPKKAAASSASSD